jgi:hypothetical protein
MAGARVRRQGDLMSSDMSGRTMDHTARYGAVGDVAATRQG